MPRVNQEYPKVRSQRSLGQVYPKQAEDSRIRT
jgi:hypothetical protein